MDNRIFIRVFFDKLLKENFVFTLLSQIVKFYCEIFLNPLNFLKFKANLPIKNKKDVSLQSFQQTDTRTNILG